MSSANYNICILLVFTPSSIIFLIACHIIRPNPLATIKNRSCASRLPYLRPFSDLNSLIEISLSSIEIDNNSRQIFTH